MCATVTTPPADTTAPRPRLRPCEKCGQKTGRDDLFGWRPLLCPSCHRKMWNRAVRCDAFDLLRTVLRTAADLKTLTDALIDALPDTPLAEYVGEDDLFHVLRNLEAMSWAVELAASGVDGVTPSTRTDD